MKDTSQVQYWWTARVYHWHFCFTSPVRGVTGTSRPPAVNCFTDGCHVGGVPHTIARWVKGFLLWGSSEFPCQMDGRPSLWPAEHHYFVCCCIVSREQLPGDALRPHCSHLLRGGFRGLFEVEQQHLSVSSNQQPPRCHWSVFLGWRWLKFSNLERFNWHPDLLNICPNRRHAIWCAHRVPSTSHMLTFC